MTTSPSELSALLSCRASFHDWRGEYHAADFCRALAARLTTAAPEELPDLIIEARKLTP